MVASFSAVPPPSSIFAAYASISAFVMLIQTMLNQFVPPQIRIYVIKLVRKFFKPNPNCSTIIIEEKDDLSINEIYNAAEIYLCSKIRPDFDRIKISKNCRDIAVTVKFAQSEVIFDTYEGIRLQWKFMFEDRRRVSNDEDGGVFLQSEKRFFELCFDKKDKEKVLDYYIPYVVESSKIITAEKKIVRLHTLACNNFGASVQWDSINLKHPSTFDTLAMDSSLKKSIIDDLDRFVRRKDFYRKVGRAWKRGYLLYGPPGTGKSSLIAAMANHLKFDIYDLELTNVKRDSDLRRLLLRTANRSILVIEDIDCTVEIPERKEKNGPAKSNGDWQGQCYRYSDQQFSLSGLLNFIDGLWSSCGDERIIVFTTNNKDKLDPALLRPGRMDMHVHMSYLTPEGFKLLASTYLGLKNPHPNLTKIEDLIDNIRVTPAEIAEELMKSDDVDVVLDGLLDFLQHKKNCKSDNLKDKKIVQIKTQKVK